MKNIFISAFVAILCLVGTVFSAEAGISTGLSTAESEGSSITIPTSSNKESIDVDTSVDLTSDEKSEDHVSYESDSDVAPTDDDVASEEGDGSSDTSSGFESSKLITSEQLNQYESGLRYLSCSYQGKDDNCYGAVSIEEARKIVVELKELDAAGFNSSKKEKLDATAEELLLFISLDEAKAYMASLVGVAGDGFIDELADGATVTTQIKMPGVEAMDLIAEKEFEKAASKEGDSVLATITKTKDEMKAIISERPDDNVYTSEVEYLKGVDFKKEVGAEEQYQSLESGKLVKHVLIKESEVNALSTYDTMTTTTNLRRYKENGYSIKIAESIYKFDSKVDEEVYSDSKRPVIEVKADFDITDRRIDEGWINRYKDIEEADLKQRNYDSTYFVLDYGVTKAERLYKKASEEDEEGERASLVKKADDYYASVRQYYVKMSKYNDEKARTLCNRYNSINRSGM